MDYSHSQSTVDMQCGQEMTCGAVCEHSDLARCDNTGYRRAVDENVGVAQVN